MIFSTMSDLIDTMIVIDSIIIIIGLIMIIRDNIVSDKKGINPQIAMVVSGVSITIDVLLLFIFWVIKGFCFLKEELDSMITGRVIILVAVAIIIAIFTVYWFIRLDEIGEPYPYEENHDDTYESDKNDEIEPAEDSTSQETNTIESEEKVVEE